MVGTGKCYYDEVSRGIKCLKMAILDLFDTKFPIAATDAVNMITLADMNFGLVISDAEIETGKVYFVDAD